MSLFEKIFSLFKKRLDVTGDLKNGYIQILKATEKITGTITSSMKTIFNANYNTILAGESIIYLISMEAVMMKVDIKLYISECIAKYGPNNIPVNWKKDILFAILTNKENNRVISVKALNIADISFDETDKLIIEKVKNEQIVKILPR